MRVEDRVCFWSQIDPDLRHSCGGPLQRAHLIPKQRIRREFKGELSEENLAHVVWHPSAWRWMCALHHASFDAGRLKLRRDQVPQDTEHFAAVWELGWSLDASYGPRHGPRS